MIEMAQVPAEIDAFAEVLLREKVKSYLEVGSKFGGSLLRVSPALMPHSRIVTVDMPGGTKKWPESERSLKAVMAKLKENGNDVHMIWGDSTNSKVIERVRALGPFDAIFIDANHTRPYVEKDFANYGAMARIVAFHDIAWHREKDWVGNRIDVPEFWNEIKTQYRHEEFKFDVSRKNNGIGVLWRE